MAEDTKISYPSPVACAFCHKMISGKTSGSELAVLWQKYSPVRHYWQHIPATMHTEIAHLECAKRADPKGLHWNWDKHDDPNRG